LPVYPGFGPGFFIARWRSFPICILWMRFYFPSSFQYCYFQAAGY